MASATGESLKVSGFNCHAALTKTATAAIVNTQANSTESAPVAKARILVRGFSLSERKSTMRLTVIAAERAETIATTIQRIWRSVGQPCDVKRAASSAPVKANGNAKTECSNFIISRMVRMRPAIALSLRLFRFGMRTCPAIHLFLLKADLREHAANVLGNEIVDRLRMMIIGRNSGHDDCSGRLRANHVF